MRLRSSPRDLLRPTAWTLALLLTACGGARDAESTNSGDASTPAPDSTPAQQPAATEQAATPKPEAPNAPAIESLLRADDTLAAAQARLGAESLVAGELMGAEGETFSGWVLYPNDPKRTADVFLDEAGTHPSMIRIDNRESQWQRADGIRIGLDHRQLEALNGGPFTFSGFGWDYGGAVTDWRGGKLDAKDKPRGGLTLCPPDQQPEDYPIGDAEFSSEDPRVRAHPMRVCEFSVLID